MFEEILYEGGLGYIRKTNRSDFTFYGEIGIPPAVPGRLGCSVKGRGKFAPQIILRSFKSIKRP